MDILNNIDKKKISLFFILAIVILYLDIQFIMLAQLKGLKNIGPKIVKLKTNIDLLKKDIANMDRFKKSTPKETTEASSKTKRLISEDEVPLLLKNLSDIANKNNIKIMQVNSAKDIPKESKSKKKPQKKTDTSKTDAVLINLDLSCEYHKLGSFISSLDDDEAIIEVQSMKISPDEQNYLKQTVKLVLKTYVNKQL